MRMLIVLFQGFTVLKPRLSHVCLPCALLLTSLACVKLPTGPKGDPWRFLPGTVESFSFALFRDGRQCWVYLPPGYALTDRRYPVLYLNDGELAFDSGFGMHVNRICEDLIRRREMEPLIVVAIESAGQRTFDYTPWAWSYWTPNGGGLPYLQSIRDTLKPEIDRRFRTLRNPANTAIAGTSLGGLIAAYGAYALGETFGKAAAFSPPYYYAASRMLDFADTNGRPSHLIRYYQDTGYPNDNTITEMEAIMLSQGFQLGIDLMSHTAQGGEHSTASWEHRFPDMLRFLFAP